MPFGVADAGDNYLSPMANYYQRLGLTYKATDEEIRSAYRELAKMYHPDVSDLPDAEERFIEITQAYEILRDPVKRMRYDLTRHSPNPRMATQQKQSVYEQYIRKNEEKARTKARKYSHVKYEKFDHEYFDSAAQYFIPKFLGCFGIGIIGALIILFSAILLSELPGGLFFMFIIMAAVIAGIAYFSTRFDIWHDEREKRRKA